MITLPGEDEIDLDIAGNNDDEGDEEDLTVEDGVVEVSPLDGSEANEEGVGHIVNHYGGGKALKEVECGALVKVLDWVLEHPEDEWPGGRRTPGSGSRLTTPWLWLSSSACPGGGWTRGC